MAKGILSLEELKKLAPPVESSSPAAPSCLTGMAAIDALLGGGFPGGKVVEVAGARASGKLTLALSAVAAVTARGGLAAVIDPRRELYPPAAAALGIDLAKLLWVRPPAEGVARAAEIVARSKAFPLVLIDLPEGDTLADAAVTRLRLAAHATGAAVVALASRPGQVVHAAVQLEVTHGAVILRKGGAAAPGTRAVMPGIDGQFRAPARQAALLSIAMEVVR